jgi:hypothetical protein
MYIIIKAGTVIDLPFGDASQLSSSDPGVVAVVAVGDTLRITAVKQGEAELRVTLGNDFQASLTVKVS